MEARDSMMRSSFVFANSSSNALYNGVEEVGITKLGASDRFN